MMAALSFLVLVACFCWFLWLIIRLVEGKPHFIIGEEDNPYLLRWFIIPRNPLFNIYLHKFMRSDDDRALHDHPWPNISIVLRGQYVEVMPATRAWPRDPSTRQKLRQAGNIVFRRAEAAHRIVLARPEGGQGLEPACLPVWTLFITGPRIRQWGFYCPKGWRHWRIFCDEQNHGKRGRGCE